MREHAHALLPEHAVENHVHIINTSAGTMDVPASTSISSKITDTCRLLGVQSFCEGVLPWHTWAASMTRTRACDC